MIGWLEGLPQTLAFALLVVAWHAKPRPVWTWAMTGLCAIVVLLSVAGFLAATHQPG